MFDINLVGIVFACHKITVFTVTSMDISQLNSDFGIAKQLEFINGDGDFPLIRISNRSADALISIYAAQVLSFQPVDESTDLLFLSPQSVYTEGQAIRGGIPVCWPWFGENTEGLQRVKHGFVRNHFWQVLETSSSDCETTVHLIFKENFRQEKNWQQPFSLVLKIIVGTTLQLNLTTYNTGNQAFTITQAFHSYFQVGDIHHVQILGLADCAYIDKLDSSNSKAQNGALVVNQEIDRIYAHPENQLLILDTKLNRGIQITANNTKTAVVWNPWVETTQKLPDLADNAYKSFVCVEVGNIAFDDIQVLPDTCHHLHANFEILPQPQNDACQIDAKQVA
jgi:glucose-6-phosphate 1-epimerase